MKYNSWEDMVDAQAMAFCALCDQNERLSELADKAEDGFDNMNKAEQDELFSLWDEVHENPFFSTRCEKEREEMEEQEHPLIPDEIPNSWDYLEQESYADLYGDEWE